MSILQDYEARVATSPILFDEILPADAVPMVVVRNGITTYSVEYPEGDRRSYDRILNIGEIASFPDYNKAA